MASHRNTIIAASLALASLLYMPLAQAETFSIFDEPADIPRPHGGMKMEAVEATYGAPLDKLDAVGQPPITRWVYDQYTVYFEYDRVIHAAVHHQAKK